METADPTTLTSKGYGREIAHLVDGDVPNVQALYDSLTDRRGKWTTPEQALYAGILERAVTEWRMYPAPHPIHEELVHWFNGRRSRWLGAFPNICDILDLDAEVIRKVILSG
jgi:hypothetical protein